MNPAVPTKPLPAYRTVGLLIGALAGLAGCGAPSPSTAPTPPAAAPVPAHTTEIRAAPAPGPLVGSVRLAPRDPALEAWKLAAAQKIHAANQSQVFEGRPHHLLQAVIVVEAAVDGSGKVIRSKVTRSPGIKKLDLMALSSLKAASPLPLPPAALVARGPLVFSETWLVQNDGRFQVRTLALPQVAQSEIAEQKSRTSVSTAPRIGR